MKRLEIEENVGNGRVMRNLEFHLKVFRLHPIELDKQMGFSKGGNDNLE